MKVFLTGQKHFGAAVLDLLIKDGHQVVGVAAPMGKSCTDRLVMAATLKHNVPVFNSNYGVASVAIPEGTDLIVAAHSHAFVSKAALLKARLGGIGYHPSLLPLHRGRSAVEWTIRMRDRVAGGSVYWLTDNVDGGPIAASDWCFVRPDDTATTLWQRDLSPMGLRLFNRVLSTLSHGTIIRVPQDNALATWEPGLECEPLHRPDRPMLGQFTGMNVVADPAEARAFGMAQARAAMYGVEITEGSE